jgi:hypothetical protein
MIRYALVPVMILALSSCGPEPTPFPVDLPVTPTNPPPPTEAPPLRYALAANTQGFVAEIDQIEAAAQVIQLTDPANLADLGESYDIVAAYGALDGWQRTDVMLHGMLVIDPAGATLNQNAADLLARSVNAQMVLDALEIPGALIDPDVPVPHASAELRTIFANMGRPDGLQLVLGYAYTPGVFQVAEQLAAANVETRLAVMTNAEIRTAFETGNIQLALVTWTTPDEQAAWQALFGEQYAINLYSLPVSYRAIPELVITLSPDGWPMAARE